MSYLLDVLSSFSATEYFGIFAAICTFFAAIDTALTSVYALRAKRRARYALRKSTRDARVKAIIMSDAKVWLSDKDIKLIRSMIEKDAANISSRDLKFIDQGLNQSSRDGAQRYARDLLSAA